MKVGMLSQPNCMEAVAEGLCRYRPQRIVIDPVMYAKNGCPLMDPGAIDLLIEKIVPLADLLTPNIPEAEKMTGGSIYTLADMEAAAKEISRMGARNVLVKGGHAEGDAVDVLYDGEAFHYYRAERILTKNTHGTGCTYSSAITANLALGMSMAEAVEHAKQYVTTAIRHALALGTGHGPTNHFYDLYLHGLTNGAEIE